MSGCGVAGCMSCAQKMASPRAVETDNGAYVMRDYPGQKLVDYLGAGAPMHGGGGGAPHHGGGHGGHGGGHFGRGHVFGGRRWFNWPGWWGSDVIVDRASCTWMPPTGRVPPSVIAALARTPFVDGWRTTFDSGWWAESQAPNAYYVCVVAPDAIGLYGAEGVGQMTTESPMFSRGGFRSMHALHGLSADPAPTLEDVRRRAVETAYPTRDVGGFDIWAEDPKVEPIYKTFLAQFGLTDTMSLAQHEAATNVSRVASFPIWPMAVVGAIAVGLFAATLAIKSKR